MAKTPRMALIQTTTPIRQSDLNPIGMIASAMLTEAQFQALNGTSWVLIDGRSIAGSDYANATGITTLPDARGMVLRGKNSGGSARGVRADGSQNPDGDVALGTFQSDQLGSHVHGIAVQNGLGSGIQPVGAAGGSVSNWDTGATGGNETRMKNITVNHFIKINA